MSKAVQGEQNMYFEMESKEETAYSGIYEDVAGESKTTSATKQMTSEKQEGSSCQSEAMFQRLLCVIAALVVISFLIATATLIVVLFTISRDSSTTSTDCAAGLYEIYRTCAMKSADDERIMRISQNMTLMENTLLKKVQDLTERLETTQDELRSVKSQLFLIDGQMGNNSKSDLEKELQNVWMAINSTAEKTSTLTGKLNNISKMGFNRSQGPVGPNGSGDFSLCQYKVEAETLTPGDSATIVGLAEQNGTRVLGASCSTNYATEYNLFETVLNNIRRYSCICRGTSNLFSPSGGQQKSCYIHYWECPLTT